MKIVLLACFIILSLVLIVFSKPLTKETIAYLKDDQNIMDGFHYRLRMLSCKLFSYSKIKSLYDNEEIDKYLNQTRYKRTFLNSLELHLRDKCETRVNTDSNYDDKQVFNETLLFKYDNNAYAEDVLEGYNITEVLQNVNEGRTQRLKEEL